MSRLLGALLALVLAGCGASPGPVASVARAPALPRFVDGASGRTVAFEPMVDALAEARVVYLGERHDREEDHDAQRRIVEALASRGSLAIGFEMFQRPFQAALDMYAAGELDEAAMLERTEWASRWGFDFAMYRPLVALGPERGARLLALNTPREVTRTVAREGLDALSEADRAGLPELDLGVEEHRAMVTAALAHHPGMDPAMLERFYLAQVIWDETMAEAVAAALEAEEPPARVVVVAGAMHVRRSAIPERAARRGAAPYRVVAPVAEAELEGALAEGRADFLFVTAE